MAGLITLSIAPVVVLAFYIYFRDKYEKEPWQMLLKALIVGALITIPVFFLEKAMHWLGSSFDGIYAGFWNAFFVASLCEELCKLSVFYLFFWSHREFNEKYDGIIYAAFISLGFAGVENLLYVLQSGFGTGLARAFTAVPAHAIFGVIMGYFGGLSKFYPKRKNNYLFLSFLIPFIFHGFYDFILMSGVGLLLLLFVPLVVYMWVFGHKKMKAMTNGSFFRDDLHLGIDFSKVTDYRPNNEHTL